MRPNEPRPRRLRVEVSERARSAGPVLADARSVGADGPAFELRRSRSGREQARALEAERSWRLVEDAGRGFQRVIPSREPLEIV
jgi:carbamate kinase